MEPKGSKMETICRNMFNSSSLTITKGVCFLHRGKKRYCQDMTYSYLFLQPRRSSNVALCQCDCVIKRQCYGWKFDQSSSELMVWSCLHKDMDWNPAFVHNCLYNFSTMRTDFSTPTKPQQTMDIDCYFLSYLPLSLLQSFPFYSSSLVFEHRYCYCHSCLPHLCGRSLGPLPACLFFFFFFGAGGLQSGSSCCSWCVPAAASSSASWPPCSWPLLNINIKPIPVRRNTVQCLKFVSFQLE